MLYNIAAKDSRIKVLSQHNQGAGMARNHAMRFAKGDFIAFLDSDDFYPDNCVLADMYESAVKNNALICGGSVCKLINDELVMRGKLIEKEYVFDRDGFIDYSNYQYDYGY